MQYWCSYFCFFFHLQNAFRPGNLSSVNMLALDALLTIVSEIESHCQPCSARDEGSKTDKQKVEFRSERAVSTSSEKTGKIQ